MARRVVAVVALRRAESSQFAAHLPLDRFTRSCKSRLMEPETGTTSSKMRFPIVGLGASAGGLEALEAFFDNMPADSGMAFVVVTHLHPERVSLMPELLSRHTAMPVVEAMDGMLVKEDHVYVAPPGGQLALYHGSLQLLPTCERAHLPIDAFFRSLAEDQAENAVAIVLSGTGSDGTLGVKEIKGSGGLVIAQDAQSARYGGMPESAARAERMDFVLPVTEMPPAIIAYVHGANERSRVRAAPQEHDAQILKKLFLLLRSHTGHDFSGYKLSTIQRRIERRMAMHDLDDIAEYTRMLQVNPSEIDLLFGELLIGVTSFFRDATAFARLAEIGIEPLVMSRPLGHTVRVWVPGCATGEEAYSIAIILRETMEKLERHFNTQIFATDLDSTAIDRARAGEYPLGIAADVSRERLERYFVSRDDSYVVKKDIREMVVFAPHNIIDDPPFTKLDLLSCRNLLIYLEARVQKRLLPIFHYALARSGILFLGSSETTGTATDLFDGLDKQHRIFARREVPAGSYHTEFPAGMRGSHPSPVVADSSAHGAATFAERALLRHLVPPSVVVHERGEVVHVHGRTGQFLEPAPGPQLSANIFNMAREGLQLELASAIRRATASREPILHRCSRVKTNGKHIAVDLRVERLTEPEPMRGLFLVSFLEAPSESLALGIDDTELPPDRMAEIERELRYTKESHQGTIEQLETANEELKSTNEELQSTNEELQSSNEELETSKEEMQSLNEELQTVNAELHGKVEELSRANDDMRNLLNGTDIATIFLDRDLHIKRYTERAKKLIRLIASDVGRPISDLVSRLDYGQLVVDAEEVLNTLVPRQVEVQSEDGSWYLMRILPYRTTENIIDGLVITFVDVTELKRMQVTETRVREALRQADTSVYHQDEALVITWAGGRLVGHLQRDAAGMSDAAIFPADQAHALTALKRRVLAEKRPESEVMTLSLGDDASLHQVQVMPDLDQDGASRGVTTVITTAIDTRAARDEPEDEEP